MQLPPVMLQHYCWALLIWSNYFFAEIILLNQLTSFFFPLNKMVHIFYYLLSRYLLTLFFYPECCRSEQPVNSLSWISSQFLSCRDYFWIYVNIFLYGMYGFNSENGEYLNFFIHSNKNSRKKQSLAFKITWGFKSCRESWKMLYLFFDY